MSILMVWGNTLARDIFWLSLPVAEKPVAEKMDQLDQQLAELRRQKQKDFNIRTEG